MITRIRLDADGSCAAEVENYLRAVATRINHDFGLQAVFGEQVIQREVAEPEGSRFGFSGRLILHPNVADDAPQREVLIGSTSDATYTWTPELGLRPVTPTA